MEEFWILILVLFFATNSLDKAESVNLFDEIFGEGWWDNDKADEWDKLTLEHNFHHQIDRQNTQIGQIEPKSTDQLGQIEPNSTDQNSPLTESDQLGQIEPNSTDQNSPLTESDQLGQIEPKSTDQNPLKNERKRLIEKFDQRKAELKRGGFKNSYEHEIDENVAKELGLSFATIYRWKRKLGQTTAKKYAHDKQKEFLMKSYYEIKGKNPKIRDEDIAKILKIGSATLVRWKSQFKQQQLHPNSVVDENDAVNVQKIENSNSGSIRIT